MLHIYTGEGKGKTTAAVGLAVRAAGAGMRVLFIQFLKDCTSSEISQLDKLGIITACFGTGRFVMKVEQRDKELARKGIALASSIDSDLLILDEALAALKLGLIKLNDIKGLIERQGELVITGRDAPRKLIELADYVSEIKKVKHPFDKGIKARKGIEF